MPVATANLEPEEPKPLKTAPPDGFVQLRRMSYGQKLDRMKHVGKLSVDMRGRGKGTKGEMEMLQKASTVYDFRACIVDHNLTDVTGRKLNLSNERDIDSLDPRIGEEIGTLIDELNNFEDNEGDEDNPGNSATASAPQ